MHSEDIKVLGINSTDLMERNGRSLDNIYECSGATMFMYDFLPTMKSDLRLAVSHRQCKFSLSALTCLDEYQNRVEAFCDSFHKRVDIYRDASTNSSNVVIFSKFNFDADDYKDPRSEPLRFNEHFGHPGITAADLKEFLFGIGIEESYSYASHRSIMLAMRSLIQLLLDVREICLRGLACINRLCPILGESFVKEPVSYIKAQIYAVDEYEKILQNVIKDKRPNLRLVP